MKKLIKRLTTLGYNLTTLEQYGNKIHFMHRQHLIIIEYSKGEYHLNINCPKGGFKNTFLTEHRLVVGISNYFC